MFYKEHDLIYTGDIDSLTLLKNYKIKAPDSKTVNTDCVLNCNYYRKIMVDGEEKYEKIDFSKCRS